MFTFTPACAEAIGAQLETFRSDLTACSPESWRARHPGRNWTRVEILGHLNDATSINIQRVVRAKTDDVGRIWYNQSLWTDLQAYRAYDPAALIDLWYANNRHLLWIGQHVEAAHLALPTHSRYPYPESPDVVTVEWQLGHHFMRHTIYHLMQIVGKRYYPVAEFPQLPVPGEARG
jgi:hypothetical protein